MFVNRNIHVLVFANLVILKKAYELECENQCEYNILNINNMVRNKINLFRMYAFK